ncbi:MAG: STAS domain-containing protein [Bacteroidales bacterium]|nr:STAS domain-containing protein [Bacteroidales bacterium]
MKISKEKITDFTVINIDGRIDTNNYSDLEEELNRLFNSRETNLIINCSGLNYICSSGLRVFLVTQKKAISVNGKLSFCNLQPAIKEIFTISGFTSIFQIFDTLEQAMNINSNLSC